MEEIKLKLGDILESKMFKYIAYDFNSEGVRHSWFDYKPYYWNKDGTWNKDTVERGYWHPIKDCEDNNDSGFEVVKIIENAEGQNHNEIVEASQTYLLQKIKDPDYPLVSLSNSSAMRNYLSPEYFTIIRKEA